MPLRPVRLALVAVSVGGLAWLGLGGAGRDQARGFPTRSTAPGSRIVSGAPFPHAATSSHVQSLARGPRPASLSGTDVDGGLSIDPAGHFRPDPDAIALFHYFLAASGEEPDAVIRQRIIDEIHRRLDPPAEDGAAAFLDRYLVYRDSVEALIDGDAVPHDLERRLQWLRELRREHFGANSEALFGEEEATLRIDLERRRIAMAPDLDEPERTERLAALEAELPDRVRTARHRAAAPARVRSDVRRLREAGADEREIFAIREAAFGAEAAERLATLDTARTDWNERLSSYRAERERLLAEIGVEDATQPERNLPAADRARLDALRHAHFDGRDLLRVRAIDSAL